MNPKNFFEHFHDFLGHLVFSDTKGSNVGHPFSIADTSSSGAPTYAVVSPSETGEVAIAHSSTNEIQNVCLYEGDKLTFDIDNLVEFGCRVKMNQATPNAATSFAIGLTSARNDAIDSIAHAAIFRVIGASQALLIETDDGVVDNDDVPTGATLSSAYKDLVISFAHGKRDVRFFVDGQPVCVNRTFDMSNYAGGLQLFAQLQKTAATSVDGFTLDYWYARGRRKP